MGFEIELHEIAVAELKKLRAFDRARVIETIEEQLIDAPLQQTKKRKCLGPDVPVADFDYIEPLWELRVGELRVFYDVNLETQTVNIRAVRRKPADKKTKDIL